MNARGPSNWFGSTCVTLANDVKVDAGPELIRLAAPTVSA